MMAPSKTYGELLPLSDCPGVNSRGSSLNRAISSSREVGEVEISSNRGCPV